MAGNDFLRSPLETVTDSIKEQKFELQPLPEVKTPEAPKEATKPVKADSFLPPEPIRPIFEAAAREFDVPVNVLMALGHQESRYNPNAIGTPTQWGRAKGMMQYLDSTASELGINPFDPAQAIPAAAKQIRERLNKGYSMEDAVKEHFAGPDRKLWGEKTNAYGREVMEKVGKIGELIGAGASGPGGQDVSAKLAELNKDEPGRYIAIDENKLVTSLSKDLPKSVYEHGLRIANPGAPETFFDGALKDWEAHQAAKTAAGANRVQNQFEVIGAPAGRFQQQLDQKLAGPQQGIVPQLPTNTEMKARAGAENLNKVSDEIGVGGALLESLKSGVVNVGAGVAYAPEAVLKSVEGVLDGLDRVGRAIGLPEWMLERRYVGPNDIIAPLIRGKDFGSYHMAGTSDIARMIQRAGKAIENQAQAEAIARVAKQANAALDNAVQSGDFSGVANVLSDPKSWAVAFGQAAPSLAVAFVGGVPAIAALEGGSAVADVKEFEKKNGKVGDLEAANAIMQTTVVNTLLEKLGLDAVMGKLPPQVRQRLLGATTEGIKGRLLRGAAGGAIGTIGESGTEMLQTTNENLAKRNYNKDQSLSEGVLISGMGGASAGGPVGAIRGLSSLPEVPVTKPAAAKASAAPAAPVEPVTVTQPAPSQATGPLSRAVENAAEQPARVTAETPYGPISGFVQSHTEDANGNAVTRVLGDDGQVYTFTSADGVQIKPESGPLTKAVEQAAEQAAPVEKLPKLVDDEGRVVGIKHKDRQEFSKQYGNDAATALIKAQMDGEAVTLQQVLERAKAAKEARDAEREYAFSDEGKAEAAAKEQATAKAKQDEDNANFAAAGGASLEAGTYTDKDLGGEFSVRRNENGDLVIVNSGDGSVIGGVRNGNADQGAVGFANQVKRGEYVKSADQKLAEPERRLEDMTEEELRARLKYLAGQAKNTGGWNKMLVTERKKVEAQINKRVAEQQAAAKAEEKPVEAKPAEPAPVAAPVKLEPSEFDAYLENKDGKWKLAKPVPVELRESVIERMDALNSQGAENGRDAADLRVGNDRAAGAQAAAQEQGDQQSAGAGSGATDVGRGADAGKPEPDTGAGVPGANATANPDPALKDAHADKWFSSREKADAYLAKKKAAGTHEVVQTGSKRFEIKPKQPEAPAVGVNTIRADQIKSLLDEGGRAVQTKTGWELRNNNGQPMYKLTEAELEKVPEDRRDTSDAIKKRLEQVYPHKVVAGETATAEKVEPNLEAAKALLDEQKKATGNPKAEAVVRKKARDLAAKTPISDEKTVLALDMIATRLDMGDGGKKALDFMPAQEQEPQAAAGGSPVATAGSARPAPAANSEDGQNDEIDAEMRPYERKAEQQQKETPADRFAGNKIFTADRVAAARERMKSKLGQLNSGIDPELMMDGMTIAGAYIEAGVRSFADYAKAMTDDFGDKIKPYLLSFYEAARNYPGVETEGMTSVEEAKKAHADLMATADTAEVKEAIGEPAPKPEKRTRKTGAKSDATLTQDWGVDHIDGYGDEDRETGNTLKDAFLKEARAYLNAVAGVLTEQGYLPQKDAKGRDMKPVSVNESGMATSGEVSLTMYRPDGGGIYAQIGGTSLRGAVPTTPSGVSILFRAASEQDKYGTKSTNRWAPTDLSAADLAIMLDQEAKRAPSTKPAQNAPIIAQPTAAPILEGKEAQNGNETATAGRAGDRALEGVPADQVRGAEAGGNAEQRGAEGGRDDAGRAGEADRAGDTARGGLGDGAGDVSVPARGGRGQRGSAGKRRVQAGAGDQQDGQRALIEERDAEVAEARQDAKAAGDYRITDLTRLGEGGQKTKYRNNVAAIRLLNELQATGRQATAEEQDVLARYVGWGGIPQAFDPANKEWADEYAELKALLTPEEWDAAVESTQYAHYTSQEIIGGIYGALKRLGFSGGKIVEPGSGVGNFIGLMPEDLRANSRFTAVERERIAGGIAKALYPNQNVQQQDFRKFNAQDGYFDAAIGNPPFSATPLTDLSGRKHLSGLSIHNYFFAKSVDMLREGGVLAMVVSNSFLDAKGDKARRYIGERTEFLGAIRLPNKAFAKNAMTEVTTDIIFLKKRPESEWGSKAAKDDLKRWQGLGTVADPLGGEDIPLNQYFIEHPEMMLGRMERAGSMYRADQPALIASEGQDTAAMLQQAISRLPEGVITSAAVKNTVDMVDAEIVALADDANVDVGGHYVKDGKVFVRLGDVAGEGRALQVTATTKISEKRELGANGLSRLKQLAEMRVTLRALIAAERKDDPSMDALRAKLNEQYDAYVKENGYIHQRGTVQLFGDDPDFPLLASLEHNYDPGIGAAAAKAQGVKAVPPSAKKAPIFTRRAIESHQEITKADSPEDALMISIAERGQIDPAYIGNLLGRDGAAVLEELTKGEKPALFIDPATGGYVLRDAYLSGNVRKKLSQAKAAGMYGNVAELEKVVPEDIPAHEISGKIGAPWVPTEVYEQFAQEIMGEGTKARVVYVPAMSSYVANFQAGSEVSNKNTFGTSRMGADEIYAALLNSKEIKVGHYEEDGNGSRRFVLEKDATDEANDKAREIKDKFNDWLFSDAERAEKMQRAYNDAVNNYVTRVFDGSMLRFPGKVPDIIIKLRRHQRNAVARIIQDGRALLDHVVGAGKTFTIIAAAMELKRTGLAKKPMIVVPNHLVKQWATDFYKLYPGANILTATKKDFEKANRRKFLAKIATGNWDAVIIAHSSFGFIKPDAEFEMRFNQERIDEIIEAITALKDEKDQSSKRTVKQLAKMKESMENKLASLRDKPMDDLLDFGQLGVDQLFVDEAHLFKNLMFVTKMQNVRGLGQPKGSQRAYDMFIKTHQTYEKNGNDRGVVFATGTPVSNSLTEMYHMLRYLAPETLKDSGQFTFDAWAKTFADVEQVWMQSMSGDGYKASNRMSRFVNTPELLRVYDQVADTVTIDDIKQAFSEENGGKEFPIPKQKGGRRTPVSIERSQAQADYMAEIAERAKKLEQRKGKPQKGDDNMLSIMGDARKAAMDIRMVRPEVKERDPNGRIAVAARNIFERYQRFNDVRGTQLVFSDMGTPKKHAEKELKEYNELMEQAAPLSDEKLVAMADLGDEDAIGQIEKAEEAQRKIEAKGQDWLDAIKSAMRGFSIYDDLKDALVEMGIPEREIAFIHDYNTDDQKAALFRAVNDGKVRVLLGSTEKMGAGTNVQERAVALHHLDVPWKPSDIEQREGRVIRQGNRLLDELPDFEVEVMAYATQDTLDLFMWQTQEKKLAMIGQLRTGNVGREVDNAFEEMQMSAGEMQAAATSNPYLLEEIQLKDKVKRLERQKRSFDGQKNDLANRKRKAEKDIAELPGKIKQAEKIEKAAESTLDEIAKHFAELKATVNKQAVTGVQNIRAALREAINASPMVEKDGKEVRQVAIEFNGKEYTSESSLADAANKALGDAAEIAYTLPTGETVYRGAEVVAGLVDPVANMMETGTSTAELGKVGDFDVTAYRVGAGRFDVIVSHNGNDVSDYAVIFSMLEPGGLNSALRQIPSNTIKAISGQRGASDYLRSKLEKAKRALADIESKPSAGEWDGEVELKKAREDYKAVLKKLGEKEADKAPDAEQPAMSRTEFKPVDTSSPEFKRWFGKSAVVDSDGKPKVVYHWTDNDFTEFDMSMSGEGAHFGTKKSATDRARGMADISYEIEQEDGQYFVVADSGPMADEWQGPFATKKEAISFRAQQPKKIEPFALYLNIKNPVRLPDLGTWSAWDIVSALPDGTLSATEKTAIMDADDRYTKLRETLLDKGIDGIVYRNEVEDKGKDSYIAFRPEQIKSATSNTGAFDPTNPDIRYSRTEATPGQVADIQRVTDAIKAGWQNSPEIVIAKSMDDQVIPQAVRDYDADQRSQGATGSPEGFFYQGKVYLIADQLRTEADVVRVLSHEALGHAGLRGYFGNALDDVLDQIIAVRRAEVGAKAKKYGLNTDRAGLRIAAEEVLAEMAQSRPEMGFVRRAVAAIRQWLRDRGLNLKMSDADIIAQFILPARAFVELGGKPATSLGGLAFSFNEPDSGFAAEAMQELAGEKAIDDAEEALDAPKAKDDYIGKVVGDISLGARLLNHPRQVAAIHPEFTPVYRTAISQMEARDKNIADFGADVKAYDHLDQAGKENVNKVLELGRLTSQVYSADELASGVANTGDKKVVVLVDGKPKVTTVPVTALLTEIGEVVKLSAAEINAYRSLRSMFDRALDRLRAQTLTEMGFGGFAPMEGMKPLIIEDTGDGKIVLKGSVYSDEEKAQLRAAEGNPDEIAEILKANPVSVIMRKFDGMKWNPEKMGYEFDARQREALEKELGNFLKKSAAAQIMELIDKQTPPEQAERLKNIATFVSEIEQAKRAGYVPFARYGDYVVTVKEKVADAKYIEDSGDRYIVQGLPDSFAEDMLAMGATEAPRAEGGGWYIKKSQKPDVEKLTEKTVYSAKVETGLADRLDEARAGKVDEIGPVREAIEKAKAEWVGDNPNRRVVAFKVREKKSDQPVKLSDVDALAEVASIDNATWDAVRDKLADAIKAKGFRRHFFHSDNVPGYTGDFERSIADYVIGMSGYLARRQHAKRWENSVTAIKDKAKLYTYATKYRDYVNNPQEELAMVRQIGFFSYIAGVMASAFANLTQVPLMTLPTLSQVAPVPLVVKEVSLAYKDAAKMISSSMGLDMFDPNKAPEDVRGILKEAWAEGSFVPLESFDLMMTARQRNVGTRKGVKAFNTTTQVVSLAFTFAERMNRLVTFIAAARLAEKRAVQENAKKVLAGDALARSEVLRNWNAKSFAEWAVDESQYRMGKANRPTVMRGVGSAILQFKGFMLQTFEAWYRMAALHGKEGKFAAASSLLALYAFAGIWGLPGADDLRKLIENIYKQITDKDLDLKTELRAWIARTSGSNALAMMVNKGIPYPLGVDLTRVGMGTVAPDSPLAAAGIPFDMLIGRPKRAFEKASTGDELGAAAELTPNFIKHWLVAGSWALEGVRDKRGNRILTPEELSAKDIAMKSLGFQPSIVTDVRDYEYAERRMETAVDNLKRSYTNKLAKAIVEAERTTDTQELKAIEERIAEIYADIDEHNRTAGPEQIIKIDNRTLRNKIMREAEGVKATWGRERKAARQSAMELREVFGLSPQQDEE